MPNVVGVRFKPVTKIYYFLPLPDGKTPANSPVIVETARGEELGWVAMESKEVPNSEVKGQLKPIVRQATPIDLIKMEEYRTQEAEALERCKKKAAELKLDMKVVRAEYSYDGSKLLFMFSSEQRVDFRELVRYLVRSFRTRVEMRQIGARDEAKLIDGYGRCGRQLCCSSWLTEFHPVSIRMAKNQQLPLAPTEISGVCGRLLCCLAYEDDMYKDMRKGMPKTGRKVQIEQGVGTVKGLNILKQNIIVELEDRNRVEVSLEEISPVDKSSQPAQQPQKPQPQKAEAKSEDKTEEQKPSGRRRGKRKNRPRRKKKT